jgi:hypothetical protein
MNVASHYNNQLAVHQGIGVRIDVECGSDTYPPDGHRDNDRTANLYSHFVWIAS